MDSLKHKVIDMVRNKNKAFYVHCIGSKLIYNLTVDNVKYTFPIDVSDKNEVGNATFSQTEKASILMRYINKSIKEETIRWELVIT